MLLQQSISLIVREETLEDKNMTKWKIDPAWN